MQMKLILNYVISTCADWFISLRVDSHFHGVAISVIFHGGQHSQEGNEQIDNDPHDHHAHLSLGKELPSKLDIENKLRGGDADEDPSLRSESFAAFVSNVSVILARGGRGHQTAK